MSELRLYTFVNFYLSSIQAGIQSAHVAHELFVKYKYDFDTSTRLYDWAENHKTMIVLNGGMNSDIIALNTFFEYNAQLLSFPAPWTAFSEDRMSLGGIMTAVGVVLPEEIYDAVNYRTASEILGQPNELEGLLDAFFYIKDGSIVAVYLKNTLENLLITKLKSCPLAR